MLRIVKALLLSLALAAAVTAPVYADRLAQPRMQVFDADGNPLAGAKLEFFESGTSTPKDTFSDDALTSANTNPVIADSAGRFGEIFLASGDYKVILKDADDVTIWTADPVRAPSEASTVVLTKTTTYTVSTADEGKLIAGDATSGAFTITLPAAATAGDGFEVTVAKIDATTNAVTVDANGSETINGVSDLGLTDQYSAAVFRTDGTTWYAYAITPTTSTRILPAGYIDGFMLSNNSVDTEHDIDIAAGSARDGDDGGNIIRTTSLTKRIDASFAEGTNQGGLDTGSAAADSVYNVWIIAKPDGTADALYSLSDSSPTMPSGFTLKRRIGAVMTDGSGNIHNNQFSQVYAGGEEYRAERATTSGTEQDFIGIRSDALEITVGISGLSTNGTSIPVIQLGDSGGVETSGYLGTNTTAGSAVAFSAGFRLVTSSSAAVVTHGTAKIARSQLSSNTWSGGGTMGRSDAIAAYSWGGTKALSDTLTQLRITTEGGSNTLDAGVVVVFVRYTSP